MNTTKRNQTRLQRGQGKERERGERGRREGRIRGRKQKEGRVIHKEHKQTAHPSDATISYTSTRHMH